MQKFINKLISVFTVFVCFITLAVINSTAATFTVTNTSNTGVGSLRQAVTDSNSTAGSDTIVFDSTFSSPQTITLASVITINPATGDSLTITGPGANLLTVSGNNAVRIFTVSSGDIASISGMTLTQAVTGAISNLGDLTVSNCSFTSNTNTSGGAINNGTAATLTINNCSFTGNTGTAGSTSTAGGAIFNGGTANINNSTFTNNSSNAAYGGAIGNINVMNIIGSTFTGNATTTDGQDSAGGAIANVSAGALTIDRSVITGNSALRDGGGVYSRPNATSGAFLIVTNSTISNNTSNSDSNTTGDGGGIYLDGTGTANISTSTINGNVANTGSSNSGFGGGIFQANVPTTITNSTVSGNTAKWLGGGIEGSGITIESSTIVNNTAIVDGGGVYTGSTPTINIHNTIIANNTAGGSGPDIFGSVISQGHNLFENTTGSTITGTTTGNITGQDPKLGSLANNGGPTLTYKPLAGSPVIDAGDTGSFSATDQRGVIRPIDGNPGNFVAQPDIGSFEAAAPTAANASISGRVFAIGGHGLARANVTLTDTNGTTQYTMTNPFGYYRFEDVEVGKTYIVSVVSKQYTFVSRVITLDESLSGLDFSPDFNSKIF